MGWSDVVVSPQYDDLSILSDLPDHLVQCLVGTPNGSGHGIPGLRPLAVEGSGDALLMTHLPTGALLRIRYHDPETPKQRTPPWFYPTKWRRLRQDAALDAQERNTLDAIPPMQKDTVDLLAGLVARLTCQSDKEGWAVGWLVRDPMSRPFREQSGSDFTQLWGGEHHWTLRWGGYGAVPARDVARALTHPIIGILDARATKSTETHAEVRLRKARLTLEVHDILISEYFPSKNRTTPDEARR
ncbi:hypothetical protein [Amycolatopsis sp. PS_44_ISF1]|uniref:hypothetical protein n=1 Tax=Amycolatopsis sp. PS_44_ISF1 TaxID=2974917 RepID=UPI0028DFAE10|nr:hypothetical protein [Amycolatopsis sp. PS_44_ISF1]MDT8916081.1 hypothetical protein [Amycolatopsis sp. PS_44_ISF1]